MPKDQIQHLETLDLEIHFQSTESGTVRGMATVYGVTAQSGVRIQQGAFKTSLAEIARKGRPVPMLWSHDMTLPIGKWTLLRETSQGLYVEGTLTMDAERASSAYALLKDGAVSGLSVGIYRVAQETDDDGQDVITEAELVEVSIVTAPNFDPARITDVNSKNTQKEADKMALDTNASELDEKLTAALDRIADLEAHSAAPAVIAVEDETPLEVSAFDTFVRAGQRGMNETEVHALQSGDDAKGGFLVPEDFRAELIKQVTEFSPMRQVARVTRTGREEVIIPKRLTKAIGGWAAELADRNESEPTYGQVKIPVHELGVFTGISNQNLEDSAYDMAAELTADFAESFGEIESEAFIIGDGVGKPTGILSNADIPVTNSAAAGVVGADDLITTFYQLKAAYRAKGAWMMSADMLAEVRKLKTANGDYIWRESLADGQPATILGRPVYEAPHMPAPVANAKAIIFGDMGRCYRVVDRIDVAVMRDPYTLSRKSAVQFHARRRVGGDVVQAEAARILQLA